MRSRFVMSFGSERVEEGQRALRPSQVRAAFNSPFWPFVLATTSIGQEGLDFHQYCHAVMHWNLPSNPVDLEQREGRVHRYKGHAVRKNLALRHGAEGLAGTPHDPWSSLFELGRQDRPVGVSDLVPFWIYTTEGGAQIERHVPILPLSRDEQHLEALRRSLAVYRMVFGQAQQEDLLAYLSSRLSSGQIERLSELLRVDLSPPSDPVTMHACDAN